VTTDAKAIEQLTDNPLLEHLDDEQRQAFIELVTVISIDKPGTLIIREGQDAENFYVILSGYAEVIKHDPDSESAFKVADLGPDDYFGETALYRASKRTASIRARTPMVLAMIRARDVRDSPDSHPWLANFLLSLVRHDATRMDRLTHQTVVGLRSEFQAEDRLVGLSRLLTWAIASMSLYAFGLSLGNFVDGGTAKLLGNVVYAAVFGSLLWLTVEDRHALRGFGVRFASDVKRELAESALATALFIAAMTGLNKLVAKLPSFGELDVGTTSPAPLLEFIVIYALVVPIQELCARGILQSTLERLLQGEKRRVSYSIVLANGWFAAMHCHLSPYFGFMALLLFVPGLLWGWLYARHRSLLGIWISHVLIGIWAVKVLGIERMLGSIFF
jgi:CRP-like cAMP-binding protein